MLGVQDVVRLHWPTGAAAELQWACALQAPGGCSMCLACACQQLQQRGHPDCVLALQGAGSSGKQHACQVACVCLQGYELLGALAGRGTLRRVDLSDTAVQIDMLATALPEGGGGGGLLLGGGAALNGGQGAPEGSAAAAAAAAAAALGQDMPAGAQSQVAELVLSRIG